MERKNKYVSIGPQDFIHGPYIACPKCGKKMLTKSVIVTRGKLGVVAGILCLLVSILLAPGIVALFVFTNIEGLDAIKGVAALGISVLMFAMGITFIINGAWQAKNGRTSMIYLWILVPCFFLITIFSWVFRL